MGINKLQLQFQYDSFCMSLQTQGNFTQAIASLVAQTQVLF